MLKLRTDTRYVSAEGKMTQAGVEAIQGQIDDNSASTTALTTRVATLEAASDLFYRPNAALVGANVNTAQDVFALDVTLAASTIYEYEMFFSAVKTAGTTSHTMSVGWAGTATINNIQRYLDTSAILSTATVNNVLATHGYLLSSAVTVVATGLNTANVNFWYREVGTVSINAGGTFIPKYQLSAAPGGAYSVNAGSFFKLRRLGAAGADVSFGAWA